MKGWVKMDVDGVIEKNMTSYSNWNETAQRSYERSVVILGW